MANTVSILSYANTFGDWVVTTNALVRENNDFAANNYIKPTGTLYLNSPTLGLQVANNAIIAGQLQVQGVGSSAYVQNNLRVDQQTYLQNTELSLVTFGQANIGGPLLALSSGTGLNVSNNAIIGGTLNVSGRSTLSNTDIVGKITVSGQSDFTGNVTARDSLIVYNDIRSKNIIANTLITTPTLTVTADAQIIGQLAVGGNFVINGSTVYNTNNFTISAATGTAINSTFTVNRGTTGANAEIRWNESAKYFDILNVANSNYYRILTNEYLSSSINSTSTSNVATPNAVYTVATNLNTANTFLQNSISNVNTFTQAAYNKANTGSGTLNGTTGQAIANNGVFTFSSNNGVVVSGSANTMFFNTPQDIRTSASPTFNSLTLTSPLAIAQGGTNANTSTQALTNLLPTGGTPGFVLTTGGSGTYYWAQGGVTYYANNTSYTVNSTIGATANTVQLAIDGLTNIVALKSGTTFTGLVLAPTATNTTSNTQIATTQYVGNIANSGYTFAHSISGLAATATTATSATTATTANTANALNTSNNYQVNSFGVGTAGSGTAGEIRATNNITAYYSDDRLKTRSGNIQNALAKVMTLNGFHYQANEVAQALGYIAKPEVGVSAQEVQAILPEVVVPAPIDEKYLTIHYDKLVPLLIEAIKELKAEIDTLKK